MIKYIPIFFSGCSSKLEKVVDNLLQKFCSEKGAMVETPVNKRGDGRNKIFRLKEKVDVFHKGYLGRVVIMNDYGTSGAFDTSVINFF